MVPRASGEALVAGVENPWKGKMLKSPPIGHFSEFSRRAEFRLPSHRAGALEARRPAEDAGLQALKLLSDAPSDKRC